MKVFTHKDLVNIAYKWVLKNASCGVAFRELVSANSEIPDVIGFSSWESMVVEVKVSRTDFLKDKKKKHRSKGMGKRRYYCCPAGLIKITEIPENWGLLYVSEKGKCTCVFDPRKQAIKERNAYWQVHQVMLELKDTSFERDIEAEQRLMYSALRRLHIKGHIESIYDKQYNYNFKEYTNAAIATDETTLF